MDSLHFCLISLACFVLCCVIVHASAPIGCKSCNTIITWDSPEWACGLDNNSYAAKLCPDSSTSLMCTVHSDDVFQVQMGYSYPGQCGCPNFCSNVTGTGGIPMGLCSSVSQSCSCTQGYSGEDCSLVKCGKNNFNNCNGHGKCSTVNSVDQCLCDSGWAMSDCSAATPSLPPIVQTVLPDTQYTSWDQYGNSHPVFNDSTLATIQITMDPKDLEYYLDPRNKQSTEYFQSSFWFYNGAGLSKTMDNVGIRIHGDYSRNFVKKSWKLSFDKFNSGRTWKQLSHLDLKGMSSDPSAQREKLCLGVLYSMDCPVQRGSYAQLFINGLNFGMFIMLEDIDANFLQSRFGNDNGQLYKCSGDLAYLGSNPQLYQNATVSPYSQELAYQPETDEASDFTHLAQFISILNLSPDSTFASDLESIFDVDLFIRTLVMEVATGQSDGIYNGNNYYLYFNPAVNMFQYFRHDLDMSLGVANTYSNMTSKDVYNWWQGGRGYRLIERVLSVPAYRQSYTNYFWQLIQTYYNTNTSSNSNNNSYSYSNNNIISYSNPLLARMQTLQQELQPGMERDNWHRLDYAWSVAEFAGSLQENIVRPITSDLLPYSEMVTVGLANFVSERVGSAQQQLSPPTTPTSSSSTASAATAGTITAAATVPLRRPQDHHDWVSASFSKYPLPVALKKINLL